MSSDNRPVITGRKFDERLRIKFDRPGEAVVIVRRVGTTNRFTVAVDGDVVGVTREEKTDTSDCKPVCD